MGEATVDIVKLMEETNKLTAILVEDDEKTNELLSKQLEKFFKYVYTAKDGKEAINIYQNNRPDIVFTDIIMPNSDGIDLTKAIKKINASQIIIAISAVNDIDKIYESVEVGVDSFINKPITSKKLLDILEKTVLSINKRKKMETKTFSISLPVDLYEMVDDSAKSESISKNAFIIRALRSFYNIR